MIQPFDDAFFMKKALDQEHLAFQNDEVPVGAIIVSQNSIIARAHNATELLNDVTAHAEMQAITAAADYLGGKYLKDCTMFVSLEPCQMCAGALYWSQISRVVFAAEDPERGYRNTGGRLHPKTTVESGLLKHEASGLLKAYFKDKRLR